MTPRPLRQHTVADLQVPLNPPTSNASLTGGTNKGPAYYGEGSPGFYSITLTKASGTPKAHMWNSLNLQHYCLGWVLFPFTHRDTATLERLASKNPPVCPSIKFPSRWRGHGPFDNSTKRIQAPGRRSPEPRALARLPPNLPPGTGLRTPSFSF